MSVVSREACLCLSSVLSSQSLLTEETLGNPSCWKDNAVTCPWEETWFVYSRLLNDMTCLVFFYQEQVTSLSYSACSFSLSLLFWKWCGEEGIWFDREILSIIIVFGHLRPECPAAWWLCLITSYLLIFSIKWLKTLMDLKGPFPADRCMTG